MEALELLQQYFRENQVFPKSLKDLRLFFDKPLDDFSSIQDLESQIFIHLFNETLQLIESDETFYSFTPQERHLTYLYSLLENLEPEAFWKKFLELRSKNPLFLKNLVCQLQKLPIGWAEQQKWNLGILDALGIKTYKTILLNHSLSVLFYYSNDESAANENTDAYIEKSTDVLYKVSDPTTLFSIIDLTKFLFYTSDIGKRFQQQSHE